jgi:hypothetical protein
MLRRLTLRRADAMSRNQSDSRYLSHPTVSGCSYDEPYPPVPGPRAALPVTGSVEWTGAPLTAWRPDRLRDWRHPQCPRPTPRSRFPDMPTVLANHGWPLHVPAISTFKPSPVIRFLVLLRSGASLRRCGVGSVSQYGERLISAGAVLCRGPVRLGAGSVPASERLISGGPAPCQVLVRVYQLCSRRGDNRWHVFCSQLAKEVRYLG